MGVAMAGPFVKIDDRCATSMKNVWAVGDLTGEPMLAHKGSAQGEVVAEIIAGHDKRFDPVTIAAVCFTEPEIVSAGLGPLDVAGRDDVITSVFPLAAIGRALAIEAGEDGGFVRVLASKSDHRLIGIQAVGQHVAELSNSFAQMLEMGAVLEDVAGVIHVHPTLGEAFHEASLRALGHPRRQLAVRSLAVISDAIDGADQVVRDQQRSIPRHRHVHRPAEIVAGTDGPADGRFHSVPSDGYVDAVAVTVLGPRRVREMLRLGGKPVYSVTYDVAADGRTMTSRVIDLSKPDGKPIPGTTRYRRVGVAPGGMAPLNGRWQMLGVVTSRAHLTDRFRLEGNHFVVIRDGGGGYDAVIGGPPVPIAGEQAAARATVTMPDDHTIVENVSVDGVP
eukprot:gene42081-56978_t